MPQASARIVQNGRKSSQLPDCKRDEGVKCHPTDRSLSIATRPEIVPPNKSNRGRSLLPKKTAPNKSPNRSVLQDDTNHTSAVVRRNARVVQNAFSNPHITKEFISSNTIEKEGLSSLQAPKIPVKNLETSFSARKRGIAGRSLPASRTTYSPQIPVYSSPQSSSLAGAGTDILSTKRDSTSASKISSICSDNPKSNPRHPKHVAGRTGIRSESQSAKLSGEIIGRHRTYSYQKVKNSLFEGTLLRPKDTLSPKVPASGDSSPFVLHQQDCAAKKGSKLATSSFANPISVGPESEMSHDQILCLQMELMQVCALHRIADDTHRQWKQSAKRNLHHRFNAIREEHNEVKRLSQVQKVSEAQAALVSWRGDMSRAEVTLKVRLLSRNISDTWQLTNPDGEYTCIIGTFEKWFDRARNVQSSRSHSIPPMGRQIDIIEPIEDGWAVEAEKMEARLDTLLRGLEHVGEVPEKTDFGKILSLFKKLLSNSLEEISIIREIQTDIMVSEISRIQMCIDDMT